MSFLKLLQGMGDRLGILETASNPGNAQSVKIITRTVSLRELSSEIKSGEIRTLADSSSELELPLEKIFETAGIASKPEDWTIDRLRQMIESDPLKNKSREEIQKQVLQQLQTEGVSTETLVKDAIARDRALDSFEDVLSEKIQSQREACRIKAREIETQMLHLQKERARLEEQLKTDEDKLRNWKKRKRAYEGELASIACYIVDHSIITTDNQDEE
jgi:hypothetical protein